MKAYRKMGWIWVEGLNFSICLDTDTSKKPAQLVKKHLADQKVYIARLQERCNTVEVALKSKLVPKE